MWPERRGKEGCVAREEGCGGRVDRRAQRTGLSELGELRRERGRNHQKQEKDTIWLHFFITLAAEWKSTKEGPEGSRECSQEAPHPSSTGVTRTWTEGVPGVGV